MDDHEQRLSEAADNTYVVRPPTQALATFGTTMVRYYLDKPTMHLYTGVKSGAPAAEAPASSPATLP